ncbi:hypothetical protein MKZ01_08790 [Lysinibacillus endophyticus]|uniref:hypothetical protein n=1 Tax=Ureibacillus endophyticus TaxID=1978490 RepID=UPI003135B87C
MLDGDGMGVAIFDECKNQVKISGNVFIALMNAKIRGEVSGNGIHSLDECKNSVENE